MSPRAIGALALAFTFFVISAAARPPDPVKMPTQYQSYREAMLSAATFDQSGLLLATPTSAAQTSYHRFEELTNDDIGYPLILTLVVKMGMISFAPDEVSELRSADLQASRQLMRDKYSFKTYRIGYIFYYISLAVLCGLSIAAFPPNSRDLTFILLFGALAAVAPALLGDLMTRVMHSHSLIPGLIPLALSLPVAAEMIRRDSSHRINFALIGFIAACLLVIFSIRKSTGLVVASSFVAFLFIGLGDWRKRLHALAAVGIGFAVYLSTPMLLQIQRIGGEEHLVRLADSGSNVGHPIYHAVLYGVSINPKNSLGLRSEQDVIDRVKDYAKDPSLRQDSKEYIEAARGLFWRYFSDHPGEVIDSYAVRVGRIVTTEKTALGVGWFFLGAALLLAIRHLIWGAIARRRHGFGAATSILSFLCLLTPAAIVVPAIINPWMAQEFRTCLALLAAAAAALIGSVAVSRMTPALPVQQT